MREMDDYSFNLSSKMRKDIPRAAIVSALLLVGWIAWVTLRGVSHGLFLFFWLFTAALLVVIYSTGVRVRFLFSPDPVLRLNSKGIEDFQFGFGLIPWDDVLEIQPRLPIHPLRPGPFIDLYVREPKKFIRRVPIYLWLELPVKTIRRGIIVIPFEDLDGDLGDALDWIRSYHPEVYITEPVEGEG